ncbi:peripherin-2-like [Periplaneta americana]|uniref:peripherin-2-like n=1 Tax=Periplaneta americana TaxID=6978 RepID=UPI0037E810FB
MRYPGPPTLPLFVSPRKETAQETRHGQDGDFVSDDVPFSCCSRTALRPCIHHGIMSSSSVYRYDPQRQFSVSTIGCQKALVTATKNLLKANIAVLLLLTALQITVSFGSRLLQTAYSSSDTGLGTHMSWIFGTNSHLKRSSQIQSELQDNATDDEEFSSKVPTVKEQETEN